MPAVWIKGRTLWIRYGWETSGTIFVVRRALGSAVKRNRLKRRLRAICRELTSLPGSLIVFPQPSATEIPFRSLQEELKELVSRLEESGHR